MIVREFGHLAPLHKPMMGSSRIPGSKLHMGVVEWDRVSAKYCNENNVLFLLLSAIYTIVFINWKGRGGGIGHVGDDLEQHVSLGGGAGWVQFSK